MKLGNAFEAVGGGPAVRIPEDRGLFFNGNEPPARGEVKEKKS